MYFLKDKKIPKKYKYKGESIMKKVILTAMIVVLSVFLSACSPKNNSSFFISNPTDNTITVKLDGKDYNLAPNSFEKVKLDVGNHSYEYNGSKTDFLVTVENEGGVINPTETAHILFHMVYETKDSKTNFSPRINSLLIEDVVYEGPVNIVKSKIIDNKLEGVRYELDEPFPEQIRVSSGSDGNIHTKIFMPKDFINFYEEETGTKGNHETVKTVGAKTEGVETNNEGPEIVGGIPDYKTPGLNEKVQKVIELDNAYANATTASEQKKINSQFKKAWKEYVQGSMKMIEEDKALPNAHYPFQLKSIGRGVIIR